MASDESALGENATRWLSNNAHVSSAAIFGSAARRVSQGRCVGEKGSDIDVHIITGSTKWLAAVDWRNELGEAGFCLRASRPATGGVRKWSIIYASAQIDLVVVPAVMMYAAKIGFRTGLYLHMSSLRVALNEMASCLRLGYVFIKGERQWGKFYRDVASLPGVRLADEDIAELANAALCDCLWILQKLEKGEVVAAQHVLHSRLVETNLRLLREVRIRESLPLPSFGLGRKVEVLLESDELRSLCVSSLARAEDLEKATRGALAELQTLVYRLCPKWVVSDEMIKLIAGTGPSSLHP